MVSRYAVGIQMTASKPAFKERAMFGSDTETMVLSRGPIMEPTQAMTSTYHL